MVKTPRAPSSSTACLSSRSATDTARIGPSGGWASLKWRTSALLNGRSHANAVPATNHVRWPCRSPSVTSGSSLAIRAASSTVAMAPRYRGRQPGARSDVGAAGDDHVLAADEAGLVAHQEHHDRGGLVGRLHPPERDLAGDPVVELHPASHRAEHEPRVATALVGRHTEWAHRVRADAVRSELSGEHLGQADHTGAGGGERAEVRFTRNTGGRRQAHDRPAAPLLDHLP